MVYSSAKNRSWLYHPPYPPSREETTTEVILPLRGVRGVIAIFLISNSRKLKSFLN